jgi:hypothetical protein
MGVPNARSSERFQNDEGRPGGRPSSLLEAVLLRSAGNRDDEAVVLRGRARGVLVRENVDGAVGLRDRLAKTKASCVWTAPTHRDRFAAVVVNV